MKAKTLIMTLAATATLTGTLTLASTKVHANTNIYRLYNANTGEHFYTSSSNEKLNLQYTGWYYEGVGWVAPSKGTPIYRIYNPNAKGGDHYYTASKAEAQADVRLGWKWDNNGKAVFYSGGNSKVYVAYNPNAKSGAHNFTTSAAEQGNLLNVGWKYGTVAFKAVAQGHADGMNLEEIAHGNTSSIKGNWLESYYDSYNGNTYYENMNITGSYLPGFKPYQKGNNSGSFWGGTTYAGGILTVFWGNYSGAGDGSIAFIPKGIDARKSLLTAYPNIQVSLGGDNSNHSVDRIALGSGASGWVSGLTDGASFNSSVYYKQ